jgi:hypothetical protein
MEPLIAKVGDSEKPTSEANQLRNDIIGGAHAVRVKEARAATAMKELFGMYIPARRNGDWTMRLKLVDKDGNEIYGWVTMADGTKQKTESVLDVWQLEDTPLTAAKVVLEQAHKELTEALKAENRTVLVDVDVFDDNGERVKKDGKQVTKQVEAKMVWTPPEQTRNTKSVAQRISPIQMLTNLQVLGIRFTPEQQEKIIVGMTNQEAAIRGRLMKH